ncbi:MAG: hypothetical protein JSV91_15140 [Phycisphaerales bacterium]|nr:MAG: hypothetical protein JSV91_15140 [Phycisphaerales bacterium]
MTLLRDVRSLFRRKQQPVEIDLTGTRAEALADSVRGNGARNGTESPEPVENGAIARRPGSGNSRNANTEELMSLVRKMDEHLDQQADRTDRLLDVMDRVPKSLEPLPEISRQNTCLVEALHDHLAQGRDRDSVLKDALANLTRSGGRQTEVLGLIQQQLEANHRAAKERAVALARLNDAMNVLASSNNRTGDLISELVRSDEKRQGELTAMLGRTQKWVIATLACCAAASVTALVVASLALLN